MDDQVRQLLAIFRQEALELTDEITEGAAGLKGKTGDERIAQLRALTAVAHTLKGAAFSVSAKEVGELSHRLEDLFEAAQSEESLDSSWFDVLQVQLSMLQSATGSLDADTTKKGEEELALDATPKPEMRRRLKVDVERLDALAASATELLTSRESHLHEQDVLESCYRDLASHAEGAGSAALSALIESLSKRVQAGRQLLREQERSASYFTASLKALRMQPLADQAPYLKQIVREAAESLDRSAELAIDVGDIEMDKQLLDELREPLMHLLRNAVGHGLASPDERRAAGKSEVGHITVSASVRGEFIEIRIADDGVGFDLHRIADRAARHGLRADRGVEAQDEAALLDLLFHDGFSTRLDVDEISGRGVGLNVVRRSVERLGGTVEASRSETLGGACFALRLPTTILSTAGILVGVDDDSYMVPTAQVGRVLPFERQRVHRAGDVLVHEVEDADPIEVASLGQLLSRGGRLPDRGLIVVLESGRRVLGVVVDRLIDQREFTAKPLPPNLMGRSPGISRATILADGGVAPCVDVGVLLGSQRASALTVDSETASTKRVLVVDDSLSTRTLQQSVLAAAGYEVTSAVDGIDAWEKLSQSRFDVVVCDIQMPRLDGFGLLKKIREDKAMRELPVILATSLASKDDISRGTAAGANEYIVKGQYDHQGLRDIVAKYL